MRIAQIVVPGASDYERKAQLTDFSALSAEHEVEVLSPENLGMAEGAVAHVYGPAVLPRRALRAIHLPYVASGKPQVSRLPFLKAPQPAHVVSPLREGAGTFVPEAVGDGWFAAERVIPATPVIGSFARSSVVNMIEQTMARMHRFREDVEWQTFDAPTPAEIASVSVWADPAVTDSDFDGYVAEAVACGVTVVAARTAINAQRLENGRTGFLVPPRDPNEMTHAILTALFKTEAVRERERAARQTASKFRVRQRVKVLLPLYEQLAQ